MAKILVVEDDKNLRDTIADILTYGGHHIVEAADGSVGVELAQAHLPDLVVSDILMPDVDGYELLLCLRNNPKTNTIPIIFLTAKDNPQARRRGMVSGADDYLTKPFDPTDLLEAIDTQLKKRALLADKTETSMRMLRKNIIYALPHEMRTPLHLILGFASLLRDDYDQVTPAEVLQSAQAMLHSGKRLQRLIENYLVYAQLELLNDPQEIQALRNHLVKDPADLIAEEAIQKAQEYKRQDDLVMKLHNVALRISPGDLKKIVEELVDNAFKFSDPGSKVYVDSLREDSEFVLHIQDAGQGMTPDETQSIGAYMQFERAFYEQQGLGLGLVIAQRLVELHDGIMEFKSRPDEGTHIRISFPL